MFEGGFAESEIVLPTSVADDASPISGLDDGPRLKESRIAMEEGHLAL